MPRRTDLSDLTCCLKNSPVLDRDNVYFSNQGWAYRHYNDLTHSNLAGDFWDEILVAGEALLENGQPDITAEVFNSPGDKQFLFGDTYQAVFAGAVALSGSGSATLSGTFQVNQSVAIESVPSFSGGALPVVHEYQWQQSADGTSNWQGFDSPWVEYDPSTTTTGTKTLNATIEGKYIRLQARATDADNVRVLRPGAVYGPVAPA